MDDQFNAVVYRNLRPSSAQACPVLLMSKLEEARRVRSGRSLKTTRGDWRKFWGVSVIVESIFGVPDGNPAHHWTIKVIYRLRRSRSPTQAAVVGLGV